MLFLDLDGCLVDFCDPAYRVHGRTCAVNEPSKYDFFEDWGMTADEFWEPIDRLGPDFWINIPRYPWFGELVDLCRCPQFTIATTPSRHANSTAGKLMAIQAMFGAHFRDYLITPRKWLLGGPGRVLIDDNEENCEKFVSHGGEAILFPRPWNENREHSADPLAYTKRRLIALGRVA